MTPIDQAAYAYVITDPNGRIQAVSRGGRELLHMPMATKGRSLLRYFPAHRKALVCSRSERGLALGLSLVKAIVEAHRGSVEVESSPDVGSRFTIRLPDTDVMGR